MQRNPSELLTNLSFCASAHGEIIKANNGTREAIDQYIPLFLDLLTAKFAEELNRLNHVEEIRPRFG